MSEGAPPAQAAAAPAAAASDRARATRLLATGLLVAMAAVFVLSGRWLALHPAWGFVHAFAEAAMVGGLADWFAVTALFRHPMGLPIPHTAIIPRNKDRIAETMAGFLRANFLTPAVVARRMRGLHLARGAADMLTRTGQEPRARALAGAAELFAEILESLDPQRMGLQVRAGLAAQLERIEIAPLLGRMLESMIAQGRHRPLMDGMVRRAGLALEDNEAMVREMVKARANTVLRWTGLDSRIADSVVDGLYRMLAEVLVDPDHPLRGKVEEGLAGLADNLRHDPETRARVEQAKRDLLANPALADWWMGVWERFRTSLIARARAPEGGLGGQLRGVLAELGEAVARDARLRTQIDRFARRTAVGLTSRHGDQIVRLVSETVKRWDATTVTARIEGAVGRDLQFIRINGTLVGGLVGLALHTLTLVL